MRLTQPIIRRLPKTDIHCHLDGCLRPRTMLELAAAEGVKLPTRRLAELTLAYKGPGVLAFALGGQEKGYPAKAHQAAFQLILKNNINSTVRAGEAFGPASIAQALHYCGAHRIGHGTLLLQDRDLMNYVNDHRIHLQVCLSSNVQTR